MKKLLIWVMMLTGIIYISCTKSEEGDEDKLGSIYGIVTELGTAEPMKAVGVELYKKDASTSKDALLLKTVTFDDGHFEFKNLKPEYYQVKVVADGYEQTEEGNVTVEAGRQARIDLQVRKLVFKNHMVVRTIEANTSGSQAILNGEYLYEDAEYAPSEVGFMYATQNNPKEGGTLVKGKVDNKTRSFSVSIEGLSKGTYYFQAYAKNKVGTEYGEVRSFSISLIPAVTTLDPTNVLAETATLNGRIDVVGDPAYKERGFVYSKSFNMPTIDDPANATTKVPVSGQNKEFSANVASLTEHSTYYVRAYATYEGGTAYGEVKTFKPSALLPAVTTLETTNILATSAKLNGRIDNAGEPAYTERGFLYSISYPIPTINDPSTATSKVVVDGTSKEYSANVSSLKEGKTYYVRAYATSSKGTSYGEVLTFKPENLYYVIIDNLMIQKEDLGCVYWDDANSLCKNSRVAGCSDWRLPTKDELMMIYNVRNEIPNLKSEIYWSSTEKKNMSYFYYYVDLLSGKSDYDACTNKYYVRAVRTIK